MQLNAINKNTCQLTLTDLNGPHFFFTGSIIRMEASDNYTIVYFKERRPFVVSKVLKIYEEMLKPFGFVRTHRRHLINTQFIKAIDETSIIMQDASVAGITKKKKSSIIKQLGIVRLSHAS
jgi:two-component system LytT family response regulator